MKKQVQDLVLVQELDALLEAIGAADGSPQGEALGSRAEEATRIRLEREQLAAGISAELLSRYARLRERYARAVVGTRGRVCLGCNTLRPTAMASRSAGLDTCERCGRILFRVEPAPQVTLPPARGGAEAVIGGDESAPRPRRPVRGRASPRATRL